MEPALCILGFTASSGHPAFVLKHNSLDIWYPHAFFLIQGWSFSELLPDTNWSLLIANYPPPALIISKYFIDSFINSVIYYT